MDIPVTMDGEALSQMQPMHLLMAADGRLLGAGPTMRKLIPPQAERIQQVFELIRPVEGADPLSILGRLAGTAERLTLRTLTPDRLSLRGHVVSLPDGRLLLNLGFGIGLPDAVRKLDLTDGDFAPSELAMELLFLHEANRCVMAELSLFNRRLEAAREAAEIEAHTDALTGLQNRRGLIQALEAALRATLHDERCQDSGFALVHLDLDRFKEVNDRHGHAAGDDVLRHVARVLREVIRTEDTAARLGGDEFVLLLRGIVEDEVLDRLSRRIIAGIETPIRIDGTQRVVSASLGIVTSRHYAQPCADQLLADADAALYRSKHEGRGRATIHAARGGD